MDQCDSSASDEPDEVQHPWPYLASMFRIKSDLTFLSHFPPRGLPLSSSSSPFGPVSCLLSMDNYFALHHLLFVCYSTSRLYNDM